MSKKLRAGFNSGFNGANLEITLDCEDYGFLDWNDVEDSDKFDITMEACVNEGLEIFYYDEEENK